MFFTASRPYDSSGVLASNVAAISPYETFGVQVEGPKRKARKLDGD